MTPTKYTTTYTGILGGRSCYSFTVDDMPMIWPNPNKVRVQIVQSDAGLRDTLRYADVMVTPGTTATLKDSDFTPNQSN